MKKTVLPLGLLFLFYPSQVKGQATADDLQILCEHYVSTNVFKTAPDAACVSYVKGWMDGINVAIAKYKDIYLVISFSKDLTAGQAVRVFFTYITEHPEVKNKRADLVLSHSLFVAKLIHS